MLCPNARAACFCCTPLWSVGEPCASVCACTHGAAHHCGGGVQDVRGLQYVLVAVVGRDGKWTGAYMYTRPCSTCGLGIPLQMFRPGLASCDRCVAKAAAYRRRRAPRAPRDVAPAGHKWATRETALELDFDKADGLCKAATCPALVARRGRGPEDAQRALPMCPIHMPVCLSERPRVLRNQAPLRAVCVCLELSNLQ